MNVNRQKNIGCPPSNGVASDMNASVVISDVLHWRSVYVQVSFLHQKYCIVDNCVAVEIDFFGA